MKHPILAISVLVTGLIAGGVVSASDDAGREPLFSVGAGARALGLGGGFVSLANDASAVYYNPAGLTSLEYHQITFMHMDLFEGTMYDFGSWAHPLGSKAGVGLAYMRIGTEEMVARQDYVRSGVFDFSTSQLLISVARKFEGGISAGMTVKLVNQSLDNLSDNGFGLDFGLTLDMTDKFRAGLTVRDMIPSSLTLMNVEERPPTTMVAGLSYRDIYVGSQMRLTGLFEIEKTEQRSAMIHAGAELLTAGRYAIRAGFDRDNFSAGVGFTHKKIRLDYAYKALSYLTDSHRFSLSILIGSSMAEKEARRERELPVAPTTILEDERRRQFAFFKEKAELYDSQFRLDSALAYYYRALAFEEHNEEIIGSIAAVREAIEYRREHRERLDRTKAEMSGLTHRLYVQAEVFLGKNLYAAALDMLQLILDIDGDHPDALSLRNLVLSSKADDISRYMYIGRKAEEAEELVDAIEAYVRVMELDPQNIDARDARVRIAANLDLAKQLNLGIELFRAGRYLEARKRFRAVLAVDPQEPVALEYLRKVESHVARPVSLEQLQADKDIWPLYLSGLRHVRDKEYAKAIEAWEKVLKKYPNSINTRDNIEQARLRLQSGAGE